MAVQLVALVATRLTNDVLHALRFSLVASTQWKQPESAHCSDCSTR